MTPFVRFQVPSFFRDAIEYQEATITRGNSVGMAVACRTITLVSSISTAIVIITRFIVIDTITYFFLVKNYFLHAHSVVVVHLHLLQ